MICFFNTSGQIVSSMETRVRAFSLPKPCCQKFSSTTCFTRTRIICKPLCRFKQHALRLTESPPFSPASNTTGSRPHRGGGEWQKKMSELSSGGTRNVMSEVFSPKRPWQHCSQDPGNVLWQILFSKVSFPLSLLSLSFKQSNISVIT